MKILLLIPVVCLASCAAYTSTEFSEFRGSSIRQGTGGSVRNVQGIDVWSTGSPNRKYKVLGTIAQSHKDNNSVMSFVAGASTDSAIIKKAKQAGGDAIMTINSRSQVTGYSTDGVVTGTHSGVYGHGNYAGNSAYYGGMQTRANTKSEKLIAVLKYY